MAVLFVECSDSPSVSEEGISYMLVEVQDTLRFVPEEPTWFPHFRSISHDLYI